MNRPMDIKAFAGTAASILAILALGLGSAAGAATPNEVQDEYKGKLKDAWLDGRIETAFALNRHLNPFSIDTRVDGGVVYLEGQVESDIERDLAREIALSVGGVSKVENRLEVAESGTLRDVSGAARQAAGNFMDVVGDATITATVKSRLVANRNTRGLEINVDTENEVVTLTGTVRSAEERDLAGALAKNSRNVAKVNNELVVGEG